MEVGGARFGRRASRGMLPLLALHVATEFHRSGRKPPVTAGLILANTLVYLRPGALDRLLPALSEVGFNPHLILKYADLKRFFLSAFYHMGESHLFYNMTSLLWKGMQLETSMGSFQFATMVATLLGLSQGITLLLAKGLLLFFDYESAFYNELAVGFSGVLFGMKVVLNAESDDYAFVHGMIIPAKYAAWAELILIQLFVPGVSFLGHLGGILAGLVYLQWRGSFFRPDPLNMLLRELVRVLGWPLRFFRRIFRHRHPRVLGRGRTISHQPERRRGLSGVWRCPTCTYGNTIWADACEMCSTPRSRAPSTIHQSRETAELSVEELRRRRIERFDR